jgi:DNA-binding beta-propeller fold protein YncE
MSNSSAPRHVLIAVLGCAAVAGAQVVVNTVPVGIGSNALAVDTVDDKVFVSCEGVDSVYVLDATANDDSSYVIGRVAVGDYPVDVVWNSADNTIWVVNKEVNSPTGTVTVINASTNSAVATVEVAALPKKAVWASGSNKLYTLHSQTVTAIDCANNTVVNMIGILPDREFLFTDMVYNPLMGRLYLLSNRMVGAEAYLHVVDCTNDQVIQQNISLGPCTALKICHAPSVNRAFVACNMRTMKVIDCASNAVIGHLPIRDDPTSIIWSTTPVNRIWVACGKDGNAVHYMRADTLGIEGRIDTPGRRPGALLYHPYTSKVFATNFLAHEILVLNARIPGIIDTIKLYPYSEGPYAMALYKPMRRIFVANYWPEKGSVTVLWDFIGIEESPARPSPLPTRAMPNPVAAGSRIVLQASGFKPSHATLVDATGRAVYQGGLGRNNEVTAPKAPGVYFYSLTDGSRTSSGKFAVR